MTATPYNLELNNVISRHYMTKDAIVNLLNEMELVSMAYYTVTAGNKQFVDDFMRINAKFFGELNVKVDDRDKFVSKLGEIKEQILQIDYMYLTLAFDPTDKFLIKLQTVLETLLGHRPVFQLSLDKSILAGALIDYKGKHVDLSFTSLIEQYFKEKRDVILPGL